MKNESLVKYYNYFTVLLAAFPLLGLNLTSILIIVWALFSLIIAIKTNCRFNRSDFRNIIVLSLLFLSYLVSFLFVEDKKLGMKFIEKSIPFLIFPLFMILNRKNITSKTLTNALNAFIYSNTILALYVWSKILNIGIVEMFEKNDFYHPVFRNIFNDETGIHLPYLGMLFSFAIYIIFIKLIKEKNKQLIFINILCLIILFISIILFSARMAMFALLISIVLFILFKWNLKKTYKIFLIISLSLGALVVTKIEPFKSRLADISTPQVLPHKGQTPETFTVRNGIYHCVKQIVEKEWLFGVGPTNVQKELNSCYNQYDYEGYDDFKHIDYNSHNQYFDVLLMYGIFGLILFIISLFWGIVNKNEYYFGFIILFVFMLITENMFARQIGIVFFTFFNSIFFIKKRNFEESNNN